MRQESTEKKIIQALQQYSSPDPDPTFEARLKSKFLQKAKESEQKRKFFRTLTWSGTAAAVLLLGVVGYYGDSIISQWGQQAGELKQEFTGKEKVTPPVTEPSTKWEALDMSKLEVMDTDIYGTNDLALYTSLDKKKLYAVKNGQGVLIYETEDMSLMMARSYPFPAKPGQYYIWFMDEKVLVKDKEIKRVNHMYLLDAEGNASEIADIPQPGYNTGQKLEWSPSGNKAYLAMDNGEEWVVGELLEEQRKFKLLYGTNPKETTDINLIPEQALKWKVAWVNDTQLVVFNPGAHAFYGVNLENQSAWEIKASIPQFPEGHYVKDIIIPVNLKTPIAIVKVGKVNHDVSFSGTERTYLLNLETSEFLPVDHLGGKSSKLYDQYYLSPTQGGEEQIMASVGTLDQKSYTVRFGLYNLTSNQYEKGIYERSFEAPLFIHHEVRPTSDGLAAFRLIALPPDQGSKEYVCVINLQTGEEVIAPIERDFISSFEFVDSTTLKVDDDTISLD